MTTSNGVDQQNPQTPPGSSAPQDSLLKQLEHTLESLYKKITWHLPTSVKEFIVKFGPWITLVLMILAIPVVLMALGLTALLTPFAMVYGGYKASLFGVISGIIALVALILEAVALPGLFARSQKGWYLVYYSVLVSAVGQLLGGQIFSMIIGLAISLYILFEIKSYYK